MNEPAHFLAFDLGAESGRALVGSIVDAKLTLNVIHRFPNGPVRINDSLYWDVLRLFSEMKEGLRQCAANLPGELQGIGVDTWGVDFALLGRGDLLLGNPYHYRDKRTDGMMEKAFSIVSREEIFKCTGIQFMQLNTLYQLLSMVQSGSGYLDSANQLLMMAGLLNFWLSGRKAAEFTLASTSQVYDPKRKGWANDLLEQFGIPCGIFPDIVAPGTVLGELLPSVQEEVGLGPVPVIAPACHDTGCAVAAVPGEGKGWAYLSSGTWSLMGVEVNEPIMNDKALEYNFTNEGGVENTFRLLKNIAGLWLVQECKRTWEREGDRYSYDQLTEMASKAGPAESLVNPDDGRFLKPTDMPEAIRDYCRDTSQTVLSEPGSVVRCALESLALKYRMTLEGIEDLTGERIERLHIVGGGTQNTLLNQFTADALRIPVIAGPIEATAIGNVLVQAIARGYLKDLNEARALVRRSFPTQEYQPREKDRWESAYEKFKALCKT